MTLIFTVLDENLEEIGYTTSLDELKAYQAANPRTSVRTRDVDDSEFPNPPSTLPKIQDRPPTPKGDMLTQ